MDLLVNSVDFSTQGRIRAIALEKFVFLLLQLDDPSFYSRFPDLKKLFVRDLETTGGFSQAVAASLVEDAQFMLTFNVVSIARNQNFFGQIDPYMREFARITLEIPHVRARLEEVLSREIAVTNTPSAQQPQTQQQPHYNVLAQTTFQFKTLAEKAEDLQLNVKLMQEREKVRELKELIESAAVKSDVEARLLSSSQEFFNIVSQIDSANIPGIQPLTDVSLLSRLQKTQTALNEEATRTLLERFGIKGLTLDTVEQVYNPAKTGIASMLETRNYLIHKGMSETLADNLAKRYIT